MGVRVLTIPPYTDLCAALSTPCDLPLDVILVTQLFLKITEGEARAEICSVNFLFFIPTSLINRNHRHVRQGIIYQSIDLKNVFGPEMSRSWRCLV